MTRYTGPAALITSILGTFIAGPSPAAIVPRPLHLVVDSIPMLPFPPSTTYCLTNFGIHCYQPSQFENVYNLTPLHAVGIDGYGETIVVVVCFGSPTIAHDLRVFDRQFGIPEPANFTVMQPVGRMPPFDSTNADMVGWAVETTLDVEYAHVFAPGAAIVLVETPVSETEGVQGFPEIVQAENYVIDHDVGDVITQSFGATEETFPDHDSIFGLRSAFENAARHQVTVVTVVAASGDTGATGYELDQVAIYPMRVNTWPSSDPLVTSVGGTQLTLDDAGNRLAPDIVWSDSHGASGGGLSAVFGRPQFQNGVQELVSRWRGTPDVSMSAAVDGAAVIYYSFNPGQIGYRLVAGTSEACPEFAGIVAMADQLAGHRLGTLGDKLYKLERNALVDISKGDNTFSPFTNSDDKTRKVLGYPARWGYDLASGLGTVDAYDFVHALARGGDKE